MKESIDIVIHNFGEELFLALMPKILPVQLLAYDGDRVGGLVQIQMGVPPIEGIWVSKIISRSQRTDGLQFVDVGVELPFPLVNWRHQHVIKKDSGGRTVIIDDITYSTGSKFWDAITYPILYMMFAMRKPLYRKYFNAISLRGN
ncbi:MAG: hypothetical protein KJP00_16560 [Bacteroidia bacterium]|nr:hypothetical protein [Bacteroidia bacterium]